MACVASLQDSPFWLRLRGPVTSAVFCFFLIVAFTSGAAENGYRLQDETKATSVSSNELDHAITTVLEHPEYSWRLPREKQSNVAGYSIWSDFADSIGRWLKDTVEATGRVLGRIIRWIEKHLKLDKHADEPLDLSWHEHVRLFLFILLALGACIIGISIHRIWKRRSGAKGPVNADSITPVVDILSENVEADKLPSDEWMNMARDLLDKGEMRLAIRAMFLASLAYLAHRGKLTIAKHKSNREYVREVNRKAHDNPALLDAFAQNVRTVENVWYGMHATTQETVAVFTANGNRIMSA